MPKLPGVNHLTAVNALSKAGFQIVRQGKHIIMSNGLDTVGIAQLSHAVYLRRADGIWSPDGARLVFTSATPGASHRELFSLTPAEAPPLATVFQWA